MTIIDVKDMTDVNMMDTRLIFIMCTFSRMGENGYVLSGKVLLHQHVQRKSTFVISNFYEQCILVNSHYAKTINDKEIW